MTEYLTGLFPIPLDVWIQQAVDWFVGNYRPIFQAIRMPVALTLDTFKQILVAAPVWLMVVVVWLAGWRASGWKVGLFGVICLAFIWSIGLWTATMTTLAVIGTAVGFAVVVGIPLGIWSAQDQRAWSVIRPILDFMQSTPSFVYLVPVVMLFGVGTVPGVIATIIFSMPPMIRLTNLGLQQVPSDVVEAGHAFGATELQLLWGVRLPLALPSIMAGLNATIMSAMIMSVIASMIGAEGLGLTVLRGIGRLDVGLAATGGLAITLMAMLMDRITQGLGEVRRTQNESVSKRMLVLAMGKRPATP